MLMSLSWAKGVEICLQKPSGYPSAQCLFFVLFFQPAVNSFNGFWISPWYTNESSVLILPSTLCISSDAKWKQNSLLCNSWTVCSCGTSPDREGKAAPTLSLPPALRRVKPELSTESQGGDLILETCLQGTSSGTPGKETKQGRGWIAACPFHSFV